MSLYIYFAYTFLYINKRGKCIQFFGRNKFKSFFQNVLFGVCKCGMAEIEATLIIYVLFLFPGTPPQEGTQLKGDWLPCHVLAVREAASGG